MYNLCLASKEALTSNVVLLEDLENAISNLYSPKKTGEDEKSISIELTETGTMELFLLKLNSIHFIYDKLCDVSDISTSQHPLRIDHIETGSLYGKLIGHIKIITMLATILEQGATEVYKNYTIHGKMDTLQTVDVETVESVVHLKELLDSNGIDTSGMELSIRHASVRIAQKMDSLFSNESYLVLDSEKIKILPFDPSRSISGNHQQQIETSDTQQETQNDED